MAESSNYLNGENPSNLHLKNYLHPMFGFNFIMFPWNYGVLKFWKAQLHILVVSWRLMNIPLLVPDLNILVSALNLILSNLCKKGIGLNMEIILFSSLFYMTSCPSFVTDVDNLATGSPNTLLLAAGSHNMFLSHPFPPQIGGRWTRPTYRRCWQMLGDDKDISLIGINDTSLDFGS